MCGVAEIDFVGVNTNPDYSRKCNAEEFFRESETQIDDVRILLDRETDSKVLSEVHVRILTRRETLPVSA